MSNVLVEYVHETGYLDGLETCFDFLQEEIDELDKFVANSSADIVECEYAIGVLRRIQKKISRLANKLCSGDFEGEK